MRFSAVPKEAVKHIWKDVERLLDKSVKTAEGKMELIDVLNGVLDGTYVLWVVMEEDDTLIAAITTRIVQYPKRKSMALDWVGGSKMNKWNDMVIETISEFAKKNDCQHLEGYGRKAWARSLKKYGFYPEYIAYRMEINNG
mgnify:FL=1